VVNCSTSISPLSVGRRLESLAGVDALPYADLYRMIGSKIEPPGFVVAAREAFARNRAEFEGLYSLLVDVESERTFNRLMSYRLTGDPAFMEGYSVRFHDQYFEPFFGHPAAMTFADCGGFDGDTTEEFIRRYPDYSKVFLFEPSPSNLDKARERLAGCRDIEFIARGVSDAAGTLFFDPDSASASAVSADGSIQIDTTTLDAQVAEPLSFIKMDLEGWERYALAGAERHIREERPILALAVYHTIEDFWRIPQLVLSMNPDYHVYLRHYTEGWSETVMYFVPTAPRSQTSQ
jgi:FkbM family methyltransferase